MRIQTVSEPLTVTSPDPSPAGPYRQLYVALLEQNLDAPLRRQAADFLQQQLHAAAHLECDLPLEPDHLEHWVTSSTAAVGAQYHEYLQQRHAGGARRYFSTRSHALYFLRGVAATKLVDGAWLYGLLPRWQDADYHALIRTYLEELGDGDPEKNHVCLYRQLLASHGCEDWSESVSDAHYLQGAIQLSLAHCAEDFLPEVIGFNLGYEQLPLHLLITAYELAELNIDPYYFTLHVTVDNASTGHAQKAVQGLRHALHHAADPQDFMRRVRLGYRLNHLGVSTAQVIASFDTEQQVVEVLAAKSRVGQYLHSDYCRFDGRTVNQWLSDPAQIPDFLQTLQDKGWIKRHEDPQHSRFWQLIQGARAQMFGVFSAYEQQLIEDWIWGDALNDIAAGGKRQPRFRPPLRRVANEPARTNGISRALQAQLTACSHKPAQMARLIGLLAPDRHHGQEGLAATRLFSQLLDTTS